MTAVDAAGATRGEQSFGARLASAIATRESQIVLGIDPDPSALWPSADTRVESLDGGSIVSQRAASAVVAHCRALIDAAGPACVAVKPQLACFERLGASGAQALRAVIEHARAAGLLVIADGKRGDIDVSVRAYAQSLFAGLETPFGWIEGLGVDAATINPLMGADTLATALEVARAGGGGLLVLVRTSNPGAADVLDLELALAAKKSAAHGVGIGAERAESANLDVDARPRTVWERLALLVRELGQVGARSGVADVGAVLGATEPAHLERARALMPDAVFLLPGIGVQGGRVEDLGAVFARGRDGGLLSASRSIVHAHREAGGDPGAAARAEAERLRELAWRISG